MFLLFTTAHVKLLCFCIVSTIQYLVQNLSPASEVHVKLASFGICRPLITVFLEKKYRSPVVKPNRLVFFTILDLRLEAFHLTTNPDQSRHRAKRNSNPEILNTKEAVITQITEQIAGLNQTAPSDRLNTI